VKKANTIRSGFTLIELLVVLTVILILVGIAVPSINKARLQAKNTEVKAGINEIHKALSQFAVDHNGFYPGMNWIFDSTGELHNGPALLGGTPPQGSPLSDQVFTVPKDALERYLPDGITPDPSRIDVLVRDGYLEDYPANPFLRVGGRTKRQMTNLFYFAVGPSGPSFTPSAYYDWNRYATSEGTTMRIDYLHHGRGHFTYIPLDPVNPQGIDYLSDWSSLTDSQKASFYKYVRSFILVGWGASRADDSLAKGLSAKYWSSTLNGYDFDYSLYLDPIESSIISLIRPHMVDSNGSTGTFGVVDVTGAPNIDSAFYGATIIITAGG